MRYSFEELKASKGIYPLLISTVIPRPIALISSQSAAGAVNCAPYSYFNAMGHDPPLVAIGMNLNVRSGTKKDTLNNVEQTGQSTFW
jgi:flavin reductase (DIM6/NTAB) family NADH-FMN oxidoreductase RutF